MTDIYLFLGLLALLKHSEILKTKGLEGQPVELVFNYDIISYKILRFKHDAYIAQFISENQINIPKYLFEEIIWIEPSGKKVKSIETTIDHIKMKYKDLIFKVHTKAMADLETTTNFKSDNNKKQQSSMSLISEPMFNNNNNNNNNNHNQAPQTRVEARAENMTQDLLFFPPCGFDILTESFDKSLNMIPKQGLGFDQFDSVYNFQPPPPNLLPNGDRSTYNRAMPNMLPLFTPSQALFTSQLNQLSLDNSYRDSYVERNIFSNNSTMETANSYNYESVFLQKSSPKSSKMVFHPPPPSSSFSSSSPPPSPPRGLSIDVFNNSLRNEKGSTPDSLEQKCYYLTSPAHSTTSDSNSASDITISTKSASSSSSSTPLYEGPSSIFDRFFGAQDQAAQAYSLTPNKTPEKDDNKNSGEISGDLTLALTPTADRSDF